jgi:hypothetical protein
VAHDEGRRCVCVTEHRPRPDELHAHHTWPLSEGGPDIPENLTWLCLPGTERVLMADGTERPIATIRLGDAVIGHDSRPHHVVALSRSTATEPLVRLDDLLLTADHLVLTRVHGWAEAGQMRKGDEVARLEPTRERVQTHVLSLIEAQPQILGAIVGGIQVDVVHDLGLGESASEDSFHDQSCTGDHAPLPAFPGDGDDVPLGVEPTLTFSFRWPRRALERRQAAAVGAELRSARTAARAGAHSGEVLATLRTGCGGLWPLAALRRTVGGARRVPGGIRAGRSELALAGDALLLDHRDVATVQRRWAPLAHVERAPFSGELYDITVAGSRSFAAEGIAVHNCPTMHANVHELWRHYAAHMGRPPWEIRRNYSHYCREVVEHGWYQAHPEEQP